MASSRSPKTKPKITIRKDGIERLATTDEIAAVIERAAIGIADDARTLAPRGEGRHGADSITYEMYDDDRGQPVARVSWGRRFGFHMMFREFGTSHTPATPFLRPAANKRRSL